jgi:Helix-turn-helix domain of resolvase/Resolvase, N terminal domain
VPWGALDRRQGELDGAFAAWRQKPFDAEPYGGRIAGERKLDGFARQGFGLAREQRRGGECRLVTGAGPPPGRLVFHMFGALAEFERSLIRERTQAGLAAARRAGRTGGRPPKLTDDDIEAAKALLANPDIGVTQIAHRLGVSPATLYRYIPAARTANTPDG